MVINNSYEINNTLLNQLRDLVNNDNRGVNRGFENKDKRVVIGGGVDSPFSTDTNTGIKGRHTIQGGTSNAIENNKMRQVFLAAVLHEFGAANVRDLPKAVKDALKIGDYSLKDGMVTSGKPLTERRIALVISAIGVQKMQAAARAAVETFAQDRRVRGGSLVPSEVGVETISSAKMLGITDSEFQAVVDDLGEDGAKKLDQTLNRITRLIERKPTTEAELREKERHFTVVSENIYALYAKGNATLNRALGILLDAVNANMTSSRKLVGLITGTLEVKAHDLNNLAMITTRGVVNALQAAWQAGNPNVTAEMVNWFADHVADAQEYILNKLNAKSDQKAIGAAVSYLKRNLPALGNEKAIKELVKGGLVNMLNSELWAPLSVNLGGKVCGKVVSVKSEINPVGVQGENGETLHFCSMSTTTNHAVNLCESKATVNGKLVFQGVRHGVLDAYDTEYGSEDRLTRATQRATEMANEAMRQFMSRLTDAEKADMRARCARGEKIELPITSIMLLTPTTTVKKGEYHMLQYQSEALQILKTMTLNSDGINFSPKVLTFNFGSDDFSQGKKLAGPLSIPTVGWAESDKLNHDSLKLLLGDAKKCYDRLNDNIPEEKARKDMIARLSDQLSVFNDRDKMHTRHYDASFAPARVAMLTFLMGGVPAWNCKSGKDRTGILDVEIKFLATQMEAMGDVPDYQANLTEDDAQFYTDLAVHGGSREIQEYNTGVGGSKVRTKEHVANRVSNPALRDYFYGQKSHVGS